MFETLETRRLMSVTLDPNTHVLSIVGTAGADTLNAEVSGVALVVHDNNATVAIPLVKVKSIYVHGKDGKDMITIDDSVTLPTELHSGDGWNERIWGGSGKDSIYVESVETIAYGGDGTDIIYGGLDPSGLNTLYGDGGNDLFIMKHAGGHVDCYGGLGNDTIDFSAETDPLLLCNDHAGEYQIFNGVPVADDVAGYLAEFENFIGGRSNDFIYGDDANNILKGGAGKDYITGGLGNDTIEGNSESDYLYGGAGNDKLDGGVGADRIYGEAGNDIIMSKDGYKDIVSGGAGTDTATFDAGDLVSSVEVVV